MSNTKESLSRILTEALQTKHEYSKTFYGNITVIIQTTRLLNKDIRIEVISESSEIVLFEDEISTYLSINLMFGKANIMQELYFLYE